MPSYILDVLAVGLCLISSAVFYLGCPNQQWFDKRPVGFYPHLAVSLGLLIGAWWLFRSHLSVLSSSFALLCIQMLALSLLPFLARFDNPIGNTGTSKTGITKDKSASLYRPQWWLRILGVFILGYPLAVGISGLFALFGPGEITHDIKSQLVMWMITPLWLLPLSLVFFAQSIVRTLAIILSLNIIVYLLLWYARAGV
ncbi:hypothetical protein [Teredinibacter sp. KSP-S5-2]|uniref:hypothetical protein n=1 Tax=Teredinibacter sp. KSP-S5-2 TaxID=3034506 RepID=UPI0029351712|nr:hypothetical protein [Teredinibacter sp. KSP-S5-2]WNO11464.1 hypothetical protein P5V12_09800 [Teredinibacter sp. KSP-S5-2]